MGEIGAGTLIDMRVPACILFTLAVGLGRYDALAAEPGFAYSAAFVDYRQQLQIFPFRGKAFAIPLGISVLTYAPDGKSLYGQSRDRFAKGLVKVTFNPSALMPIPYTDAFRVGSIAVSQREETIVISGSYPGGGSSACGLFELDIRNGKVSEITQNSTCEYSLSWVRLSLSPNGTQLVAYRKPRLELINLVNGTVRPLIGDYIAGAWSPDGKWLAVLEGGGQHHTILLDSMNLKEKRSFGETNVDWSPDSRFLLGARSGSCSPYWSSLVAVDVQSGKETVIDSSRCKVNFNTIGWVSSGVRPLN
jgi:WD40 repeat protein